MGVSDNFVKLAVVYDCYTHFVGFGFIVLQTRVERGTRISGSQISS